MSAAKRIEFLRDRISHTVLKVPLCDTVVINAEMLKDILCKNLDPVFDYLTSYFRKPQLRDFNPYPTAFPYGNGMVLHFYQQQESSTTKTVHKVINKGLKTYV